ncbi:MAG: anthranilate synthase component I family protein [Planctomycetes bacterium]|nr:anthranilate synthase component I family protein [Planctomycetota bacterium]MCC7062984.1 anthranilate synthase component I family protein [Planctomycetota bacterium]
MPGIREPGPFAGPFEGLRQARRGEPVALLHSCGAGPAWLCTDAVEVLNRPAGDVAGAFAAIDEFVRRHADRRVVGWLGYDLGLDVEAWPLRIEDDFPVPVLHLAAYATVQEFAPAVVEPAPVVPAARELRAHVTQADYERRVAAVVEHICAGDIFQANLTQPFTAAWEGDPRDLFWRLCERSPAPFAAYVEDGAGTAVLSSSPEEFLWRQGTQVRTRPIKGTARRSTDPEEDRELLAGLLHSEKDQAELAMIIDLLRNDLGKVAATGTVRTGPFPEHASFAQVHHLYATVTAQLRPEVGTLELLRATFPGGSITGCPKLRCLEILEQLEVARRGVYTGAIGWFGPGDAMHLNIAIRTLVHRTGRLRGNAGGGVTALSDPHAEWLETLHKMAGLERALHCSVQVPPEVRP